MSKIICGSAIEGAYEWIKTAEAKLEEAIQTKRESYPIAFPNTAYFLPVIYSFTGEKIKTLGQLNKILRLAKELLPEKPSKNVWLPYLGKALEAGIASLFACEIIEACKYIIGPDPTEGIWLGAAEDKIIRERGIEFVDGTAPGFAGIIGAAPSKKIAVQIARELQEKNLYVFMGGSTNGRQFAEQLSEAGVKLGWDTRLVPYGRDVSAMIYALGFASRVALSFGGVKPGDFKANLRYNKNRVFAFVLTFGEVTPAKYAVAAGAINYGFPIIADTPIPEILPTGVCTYEHVVSSVPYETMIEKALEVRGCKVLITKVPIPAPYGPAFEGERIRKEDMQVEFGGNRTTAFEFVSTADLDKINDGDIKIIGPDIDEVQPGSALPLSIWVEVAGRKMQTDFEPILERQIHRLINGAEGLWHMGQRDIIWTRVSKSGFAQGLGLKHYGEILHAKLLADYPAIVDKVKVTLITENEEVEKRIKIARKVYDERNRRLQSMTDESVDTFYSCLLCQSFAPNHVCIITPERLGLCGAYNWLDGKAAHEIDKTGPNQPIIKGDCLEKNKGVWKGVNEYVYTNSHKTISTFSAYSIMDHPMTSCGCFEVICAYVPECNGIMAVNREFQGDTPVGMNFSTLAGMVGGGQQTPGFMGCGKVFLSSKKFLFSEGGHRRLVWMPKELKTLLEDDLKIRFQEQGIPDLLKQIADEEIAIEPNAVRDFLEKNNHPALKMEDMSAYAQSIEEAKTIREKSDQKTVRTPPEESTELYEKKSESAPVAITEQMLMEIKEEIVQKIRAQQKEDISPRVLQEILNILKVKFPDKSEIRPDFKSKDKVPESKIPTVKEVLDQIKTFTISREKHEVPTWTVKLGATKKEGGTRGFTPCIGGETCMPFHLWEGEIPFRPLVALEVFDRINEKYPQVLRNIYGDLLENPVQMARICVEKYGADLISVRLEGSHPEKGNRTPRQSVELVKSILRAVEVPLIITGHKKYERNNEVMKAVARECAGENLLLNWVEQDNYRTIASAALAYGHSIVAQSPIDVNIAKQMNILLTNMDVKTAKIVMDPMTGAVGYGIEYTYSVMERIRLTALNGDQMLAGPMIVTPGQECVNVKEYKAAEKDFPAWGDLRKRAALWELSTALSLLYSGADLLIMYHPEAAKKIKQTIFRLMEGSTK